MTTYAIITGQHYLAGSELNLSHDNRGCSSVKNAPGRNYPWGRIICTYSCSYIIYYSHRHAACRGVASMLVHPYPLLTFLGSTPSAISLRICSRSPTSQALNSLSSKSISNRQKLCVNTRIVCYYHRPHPTLSQLAIERSRVKVTSHKLLQQVC